MKATSNGTDAERAPSPGRALNVDAAPGRDERSVMGPEGLPADYEALEHLGSGGQADVWRVRRVTDATTRVAKLYRADGHAVLREAEALSRVAHDAIPQFRGVIHEEGGRHCLFLDDVEGVTLTEWASIHRGEPTFDRLAGHVVRHLAGALAVVHGARLAHRDLKPDNVLVAPTFDASPDRAGGIKLIDFGISSDAELRSRAGTRAFFAPERLVSELGESEGKRADVFAWGLLVGWLFSGRLATGLEETATLDRIRQRHEEPDAYADGLIAVPARLRGVVRAALVRSPSGRLADGTELLRRLPAAGSTATLTEPHEPPAVLHADAAGPTAVTRQAPVGVRLLPAFAAGSLATVLVLLSLAAATDSASICDQAMWPAAMRTAACRSAVGRGAYLDQDRARRLYTLALLLEARGETQDALLALAEGVGACKWTLCTNVGPRLEQSLARLCRAQTGLVLPRDWSWAVVTARNDATHATLRAGRSKDDAQVGAALQRGSCVQAGDVRAVAARDAFVSVATGDGRRGFLHVDMIAPVQRYIAPFAPSASAASTPSANP